METLILLGAGQMGKAALGLVNRTHYTVLAFADNQPALHGTTLGTYPVLSVEEAVAKNPTHILIAVAGQERTEALRLQLRTLGYTGGVHTLQAFADALDIRSAVFSRLADRLDTLPGALAELGVYRGDFAAALNRRFPERTLYLFDTFAGFDARDIADEQSAGLSRAVAGDFSDTSEAYVLSRMTAPGQVVIRKGYFPATAEGVEARFALVSLDADLYAPTLSGLRWFYPRMVSGGVILLHDYENQRFPGVKRAVEAFEAEQGRTLLLPVGDLHGSVMLIRP